MVSGGWPAHVRQLGLVICVLTQGFACTEGQASDAAAAPGEVADGGARGADAAPDEGTATPTSSDPQGDDVDADDAGTTDAAAPEAGSACVDEDADGRGQDCAAGPDCDDGDGSAWALLDVYVDADGDGVAVDDVRQEVCAGDTVPAGFSAAPGADCDDTDGSVAVSLQGYTDADLDGVAAADTLTTLCTDGALPAGHVAEMGDDCDDGQAAVSVAMTGYVDGDGDGIAVDDTPVVLCTDGGLPAGYAATAAADCDDTSATLSVALVGYQDGDRDGVAADATPVSLCTDGALPVGYVATSGADCDDGDADVSVTVTGYLDADADGVAVDTVGEELCTDGTLPGGYLAAGGQDCDDGDTDNWDACATCDDGDGDGVHAGCDRYVVRAGPDCEDVDRDNWDSCDSCNDGDADGWFTGCDAYTERQGPDCDDGDGFTFPGAADEDSETLCMRDADEDGYGDTAAPPGGAAGTDCGDDDANNHSLCAECEDGDGDGAYVGCDRYLTFVEDCDDQDPNNDVSCATCVDADADLAFTGCDRYETIVGPDCADDNPDRHPAEPELADDGVDNDCVGGDLVAAAEPVGAHYVAVDDPNCDDNGVGSMAQPYCTLFPAVTDAAGGPIFVAGGTYPVQGTGNDEHRNLNNVALGVYGGYDETDWKRDPAVHTTTIDFGAATGYGFRLGVGRLIFEHVRFVGDGAAGGVVALFTFSEESFFDHIELDWTGLAVGFQLQGDTVMRDSFFTGETAASPVNGATGSLTVLRSRFEHESTGAAGSLLRGYGDSLTVANSEFISSHASGGLQPAIWIGGGTRTAIVNNAFLLDWAFPGPGAPDCIQVQGDTTDQEITILNNAMWAASGVPRFYNQRSSTAGYPILVVRNNMIESATFGANTSWAVRQVSGQALDHDVLASAFNGCSSCTDVQGNVDADPGFLDVDARDFRAGASANMVDAGLDPQTLLGQWHGYRVDRSGRLRPIGPWDVGAFELND